MSDVRIGIDIGGTFTDIVVLRADGSLHTKKVSSTVDDYARDRDRPRRDSAGQRLAPAEVAEIRHGTTVASNAILERKGARTGLIATEGFRDILEIRTLRMPRLYDMTWQKPPVLVPRYLRVTVDERLDAAGRVQRPLAPADAERAVRRLLDEGSRRSRSASCTRTRTRCTSVCSRTSFSASPRICPARSARGPARDQVRTDLDDRDRRLRAAGRAPVSALAPASPRGDRRARAAAAHAVQRRARPRGSAAETPVHIVESGPAAGVVGAQALAAATGLPRIITLDMGGTTAKAALVEDGEVTRAAEYQVGGGIMRAPACSLAPAIRSSAGDRPRRGRRGRRVDHPGRRRGSLGSARERRGHARPGLL